MHEPVLSVKHLTKRYDDYLAVDHISFDLAEGEILGLLGPNGAGKTTTIQMLLGLTTPDGGDIHYFGLPFRKHQSEILERINFASTYMELQGKLTVYQNLRIYAGFYQVPNPKKRIYELLELFEIEHLANELFWHLSSGQKTRAILAKSLLNRPRLLLMDEPTASLDPEIVNKIIDLIKELRAKEKVTILFTSHNMTEVTRVCDRVMFLQKGKIVTKDTPLNLTKKLGKVVLKLIFTNERQTVSRLVQKMKVEASFDDANTLSILTNDEKIPAILHDLQKAQVFITNIDIEKPTLEDVFLELAKGQHEVASN